MNITLKNITVNDVSQGYVNKDTEGVFAYNGLLNIRPPYQREFIYKDQQRDLVIDSVKKGLPLNIMYWSKNSDGTYEVLDGQQRTISILEYVHGNFSIDGVYFHSLTEEEKNQILNYKLMVYVTEGSEREKLDWFHTINIAGEKLTDQELRNAVFTGPWLSSAKEIFSKPNCPCYVKYKDYFKGSPIRQEYLETALKWISDKEGITIEAYMSLHQFDENAGFLWQYVEEVMAWVTRLFPEYRREMKGLAWGMLYNEYKDVSLNPLDASNEIKRLLEDDDVTQKKGVYAYLLSNDEKYLNIRRFSKQMIRAAYERQNGVCPICGGHFKLSEMEADHITPWSLGGKTSADNCQMLCKSCNRKKSNK